MASKFFNIPFRGVRDKLRTFYSVKSKFMISSMATAAGTIILKDDPLENVDKAVDPASLTHMYLIKNASLACIDSASSLLTQTASNLIELEQDYTKALKQLAALLEASVEHADSEHRQAALWDAIVQVRSHVASLRQQRQDMESMLHSAERMLHAAAEAALISGAEYASTVAGERIFSAQCRLRGLQDRRIEMEGHVASVEANYIHEISEHHRQKRKKQKQQKDTEDGGDDEPEVTEPETSGNGIKDSDLFEIKSKDSGENFQFDSENETFKEEENFGEKHR